MRAIALITVLWPLQGFAAPILNHEYSAVSGAELMKIIAVLLFIVMLILFLSWLIKRLNKEGFGLNHSMVLLGTSHLGVKEKMVLVKVGTRVLLLGVASGSVTTLCDFGENLPEGFVVDGKKNFADVFKNALRSS